MSKSVKRVVKNSFFQTVGSLGISGLNFVLTLGYGRLLAPLGYGSLTTSQNTVIVLSMLVDLGLTNSLIGALTSAEGGRSELARQGFRGRDLLFRVLALRVFGACVGTAALVCYLRWRGGTEEQFWQDLAFTPFLFASAFQQTASAWAMYHGRHGMAVGAQFAGVLLTVVLTLTLAFQGAGISWLLVSQSWGGFFGAAVIFGYFLSQSRRRTKEGTTRRQSRRILGAWGIEAWRALFQDAWPYFLTYSVFVLWQRMDQLAVSHLLGLHEGGLYSLAVRLVSIPMLVASGISAAIFPDLQRVGRDAPERVQVILGAVSKAIWRYGIIVAAILLGIIALIVVPILPKFRPALGLLPLFVPGVWAYWNQAILVNSLFGLRAYKPVVRAHLISLALFVPSLYLFTVNFGLKGVVVAFDLFCLSMWFFSFRAAKKRGLFSRSFSLAGAYSPEERSLWEKARLRTAERR